MRSSVFPLFPPVVRDTLVLTGWSRHCRITAGLASMDVPLLVSLLSLSAGGAVRGSTAPVGWSGSPPTSPIALLLAFRPGAPSGPLLRVFALSLRDGVTLPGRVCLSPRSDRRLLLHLPGVCFEASRWGHPVGSWFVPDLDRNEDLFGAPSLVVGVWPSRWGHPFWVEWLFYAPSIGTKASSIHLSLVASRWGHPAGRVCGFPHSIVTKLSLVSCLVFLQDEVTLTGLDL